MQASHVDDRGRQGVPGLLLGNFEYGIIKRKVRQIIGCAGYTNQDREDLEQLLLTRLVHRLPSFDPTKAHWKSFVTVVVERSAATIIRDARAEKRGRHSVRSLQERINVGGHETIDLSAAISERALFTRRGLAPRSAEECRQLQLDVNQAVASLPEPLRLLAERLKTQSIAAIARELGIPRTTLNSRMRQIRRRFEEAGLRIYL